MNYISARYEALAFEPIIKDLDSHRDLFKTAFESLDSEERAKFEIFIGEKLGVNPFERQQIMNLWAAGLDAITYEELLETYT